MKMHKRLITTIIAVAFLVNSAGQGYALRPMAAAISNDMSASFPSKALKASSAGSTDQPDAVSGLRSFDDISREYQMSNRRYAIFSTAERQRMLVRLKYVVEKAKDIPDFLIKRFKEEKIISIVALGDYLSFWGPSDIEFLIITEGKGELAMLQEGFIPIEELLKDNRVVPGGIRCAAATIGYERLKKASAWEVFTYAIMGWREGITIFGADPYQSDELVSCTENIRRLDYLLEASHQAVRKLQYQKQGAQETVSFDNQFYEDRVKGDTAEAISILKKIAAKYDLKEITRLLEAAAGGSGYLKSHTLNDYYLQTQKAYDALMKGLETRPKLPVRELAEETDEIEILLSENKELSRTQLFSLIPERFPEYHPRKLLEYINRHRPGLLDDIADEERLEFLRSSIFLGYETRPLPKEVSDRLPGLKTSGQRVAAIIEARGKRPEDIVDGINEKIKAGIARTKAPITPHTYRYVIEKRKEGFPGHDLLWDLSRELEVDPIRIIDGRDWDSATARLSDPEKMKLCRLRKGWSGKRAAEALEIAGFEFTAATLQGKQVVVLAFEKGEEVPTLKEAMAIRKVYCEDSLFLKAVEEQVDSAKAPADLSDGQRLGWYRKHKKCWTKRECIKQLEAGGFKFDFKARSRGSEQLRHIEDDDELPSFENAVAIRTLFDDETLFPEVVEEEKVDPADLSDSAKERFSFLGYETVPLPGKILKRLPGITSEGARVDAIREARGMEVTKLCKMADITRPVYMSMVKKKVFSRPENVIRVSKALQIDAIYIKKGMGWDKAAPDLEDKDKMFLCRFRKGWAQRDFIDELKKAGLNFESDSVSTIDKIVIGWERDGEVPKPQQRKIIKKVLGEDPLYDKADKAEKADAEGKGPVFEPYEEGGPRYLRGVRPSKIHIFLATHWEELKGLTTGDIEARWSIPSVSIRVFLRNHKGAAEAYGINYPVKGGRSSAELRGRGPLPSAGPGRGAITPEEAAAMADWAARGKSAARIQSLKVSVLSLEKEAIIEEADEVYESLKSPRARGLVGKEEIEEAISKLAGLSDGLQSWIEVKPADADGLVMWKEARKRWIGVRDLSRKLQALAPTKLCDWDNPRIREKAAELIEGLPTDLSRKSEIVRWVDANIRVVPERKGCFDMKASETFKLSEDTSFNRLNLIVAMLRSVGIPTHYRILSLKTGKAETVERIVPEALICIEEQWDETMLAIAQISTAETLDFTTLKPNRRYKLMLLEEIDPERVVESSRLDNIDEFAAEKAKERRGKNPGKASSSGQLKALKMPLNGSSERLARAQERTLILHKYMEDAFQRLLDHVNRYRPHFLHTIPVSKRFSLLIDLILLGYETVPLPKEVSDRLPGLKTSGQRVAAIIEARGKRPEDIVDGINKKIEAGIARREVPMSLTTYKYNIEKKEGFLSHDLLSDISRELEVDPIRIIDGRDWDSATAKLTDLEKIKLYRQRKGWTGKQAAAALERAGFEFTVATLGKKQAVVFALERGDKIPTLKEIIAIRRTYYDDNLFSKAVEGQGDSAEAPADLSDGQRLRWYRENKKCWTKTECVRQLEAGGFKFKARVMSSKIHALDRLEDKELPGFENALVIQKLFGDKTLFKGVAEEGRVDPAKLSDGARIEFRRNEKGWTRKQLVTALEKGRFKFTASNIESKVQTVFRIERRGSSLTAKEAAIVQRVLGDKTLFAGAGKKSGKASSAGERRTYMAHLAIRRSA